MKRDTAWPKHRTGMQEKIKHLESSSDGANDRIMSGVAEAWDAFYNAFKILPTDNKK